MHSNRKDGVRIYTPDNCSSPGYQLRYVWTGWIADSTVPNRIYEMLNDEGLLSSWEHDGLRLLEKRVCDHKLQLLFSATPQVSPVRLSARAKGRLQYTMRCSGIPIKFSRKLAVRTVGENRRQQVEQYIRGQIGRETADPALSDLLRRFQVSNKDVDLAQPTCTESGRYWYNLHLVLVSYHRERRVDTPFLSALHDQFLETTAKGGHAVSTLSVLPDHLHASLRGNINQSPEAIALTYLNDLADATGGNDVWQYGYYVGTFSEYDMGAIRKIRDRVTP